MNSSRFNKKKILIISTSRSDFGLLKNTVLEIKKTKNLKFKLLVTGSHFISKLGLTKNEIKTFLKQNVVFLKTLKINDKKKYKNNFEFKKLYKFLNNYKPDVALVLGDRFEALMITSFLSSNNIPIAHISGGDLTFNTTDDNFRHAITKLSSVHFPESEHSRKILLQLGEEKKRIHKINSLSYETIKGLKFTKKNILEKKYDFKFDKKFVLFTFHPILGKEKNILVAKKVFRYLNDIIKKFSLKCVVTYPNSDIGFENILDEIKKLKKNKNFLIIKNLGIIDYLSLLKISELSMGNSSSCLIDAYYLNKKSLLIGNRQNGRKFHSKKILKASYSEKDINQKFKKLIYLKEKYSQEKKIAKSPNRIANVLNKISLPLGTLKKFQKK